MPFLFYIKKAIAQAIATLSNNTALLLRGDGANNQNNNVFVDSSSNNFTIMRNGNTTQGSFTPFSRANGEWGVAFDGTSDYLLTQAGIAVSSTSDWTLEAFIQPNTIGTVKTVIFAGTPGTSWVSNHVFGVYLSTTNQLIFEYANGTVSPSSVVTPSPVVAANEWAHIAIVYTGSTKNLTIYANGTSVLSQAISSFTGRSNTRFAVGRTDPAASSPTYFFSGQISNVRFVNSRVYTANFTPTTSPLTAVAGTQLLTCQSNRFVDNSTNNFTIVPTGTPRVVVDSPFTREYNPATMGGSAYFDGAGDNLIAPNSPVFGFGTEDYTVEGWFYQESTNGATIFDIRTGAANTSVVITIDTTGSSNRLVTFEGGQLRSFGTPDNTPRRNSWNHIAVARGGGVVRLFVNGVLVGSYSSSTNYGTTQGLLLGANYGADLQFRGFMSNINIIKGSAVYTTNFTPPSAPVAPTAQTSLLLNFTNGGIIDSTGRNVIETIGDARISTAVARPGQTSSIFFDGTGDFITAPSATYYNIGASDFTIECWFNAATTTTLTNGAALVSRYAFSGAGTGWLVRLIGGNAIRFLYGNNVAFDAFVPPLSPNTWYHVAVSRSGSSLRIFLNGVQVGTTHTIANFADAITTTLQIGRTHTLTNDFHGYIDDVRITRAAMYTANFTPPASI